MYGRVWAQKGVICVSPSQNEQMESISLKCLKGTFPESLQKDSNTNVLKKILQNEDPTKTS